MTDDIEREADGRWRKGHNPNPGGVTRAQARIARMLEDMTEEAARRLRELMASPDEAVALGAVKEWLHRVAPPPPKAAPPVNVNVNLNDAAAHIAVLRARVEARKPTVIDATPVAPATSALPARATPTENEEA